MPRRTMILIVCNNTLSKKEEYHTWCEELKDFLREQIVCYDEEYRIETPYVIINFVRAKPLFTGGYKFIFDLQEDLCKKEECEKLLKLATGKDI